MPEISLKSGGGLKRFPLEGERFTIGRSRQSDVCLQDQWLSRHHAEVLKEQGGYYLRDLGSKNGTLLNEALVQEPKLLRNGDLIRLGDHVLVFSEDRAPDDEPEPEGTRVFSAREFSGVDTKPAADPEEIVRQARLLEILSKAVKTLLEHSPLPELFERILDLLFDAVPAERAAILILEGDPPEPVVKASRSRRGPPLVRMSRSIARKVLNDKVSMILPNLMEDAAFKEQESIVSSGIRSAICAPLWFTMGTGETSDEVIGLVYLDSLQRSHSFTEDDVRILTPLANVAAAKIENVRLMEESLEKRQLEQDMRMAAQIQRGLLPDRPPAFPGYGLAASNTPCRAVGGDYYDFDLQGDELLLALGDVSGKGTSAALLMTVLRAAVRAHWDESSVAEAMSRVNRTVCQNTPDNKYVTFFLGRLDPGSGRMRYVNAGHNPPLLLRAEGGVVSLEEGGTVLGMFESALYTEGSVELRP
ncbi:MAG TPA: SpoIIE family protein phosphatase, partial [Vicinamibacteria bacterium]|nr:SpoIIE family protein phosphatase [Vicinamibacteria bacterium]